MAKHSILQTFYASGKWRNLRQRIILERQNQEGFVICEECGQPILKSREIHVHHKIDLTPENVKDHSISLNPDLVQLIHKKCHDKKHYRFGYKPPKKVYIVYGSPLSGKTSFVLNNMERGDLVIDMDKLFSAVSLQNDYDKPDNLLSNVIAVRDTLIDNVKHRYGKWFNAWIIGGYAESSKRERLADDLGAELVYIEATKEECYARLEVDEIRRFRKEEYKKYINKWFEEYC
jgi:hypothetical protein